MKIHIAITTYNREQGLLKLLKDIEQERGGNDLYIHIYDDGSNINHSVDVFKFPFNNGKQGYWRIIDRAFQDASQQNYDYFFLLQDDCELTPDFFNESIRQFENIDDEKKATFCTFTPLNVYSRTMWAGKAENISFNGFNVIKGNYVDCIFMCPRKTLERLHFRVLPINLDWDRNPNLSSGVGMQLTQRLHKLKRTMYTAYSSLVITGKHTSEMNAEERKRNPLLPLIRCENDNEIILPKTGSVFIGIASIPKRKDALYQTLKSLYRQADKIFVALNGYEQVPEYAVEFNNVEFYLTSNERGDANKFLKVADVKGFFLTCDDDIIYPESYVKTMIAKLNKYGKSIVTCHGRVVTKKVNKFYHDTEQHHFQTRQQTDIPVHIPGTGVCAFHTDNVKITLDYFKYPNMADIWLGLYAQENNIPVICIEKRRRWLQIAHIPQNETIYHSNVNSDEKQVELTNSIIWK